MVPDRGTAGGTCQAVSHGFAGAIDDFGGIAVAVPESMETAGCYEAGSVELLTARHRWAMGALAAGAVGMFVSALATGVPARPADIWILSLDGHGRSLTRMACAVVR